MIARAIDCFHSTKDFIKSALSTKDFYLEHEEETYSSTETLNALRFVLGSHATDYRLIMEVEHSLRVVTKYLLGSSKLGEAEDMLAEQEEALLASAKYCLFMYKQYLEHVVPANIAFYHFIRQKNYYGHIMVVRYVMIVGFGRNDQNVFHKLKNRERLELLRLLSDWLFTLIHYRCSAIYLESSCVDPLIRQTYLLLASILGFDRHSQILHSLLEGQVNELFNKLLYVSGFVLSMGLSGQDSLALQTVLAVLRKLLISVPHQKVNTYLPSYLFAKQIGYIPAPYTHLVIYSLLLQFALSHHQGSIGSGDQLVDQQQPFSLLTETWSIINLLSEEYPGLDRAHLKELVRTSISFCEAKSMTRAFLVRTALSESLDLEERSIGNYLGRNKLPYLIEGRVVGLQTFCKNYHIVMDREYLRILREASKGTIVKIEDSFLWKEILKYNKYEILTQTQYIQTKTYEQQK